MTDTPCQYDEPSGTTGRWTFGLIVLIFVVCGAWLRFGDLARRGFWLDESCTYYAVANLLDWPATGPDFWRGLAHLPYFLLLKAWTSMVGADAFGLRSFSALAGCLAIPLMAMIGQRIGGRRAGLIAAAITTVHPLHVYYSQEARVYALWMLVGLMAVYSLLVAVRTLRRRSWITYAVIAWLLVLVHYYSLLWLPATIVVPLLSHRRRDALRGWINTHLLLGFSFIPLIWFIVWPMSRSGPRVWLAETWAGYPPWMASLKSLWALMPSGDYPHYLGALRSAIPLLNHTTGGIGFLPRWGPSFLLAVMLASAAVEVFLRAKTKREDKASIAHRAERLHIFRWVAALVGSSIVFLLIAQGSSWLMSSGYVVGRYDVLAWPGIVLGIALLVSAMPTVQHRFREMYAFVPVIITTALCGCGLITCLGMRLVPEKHDQSKRASRIAEHVAQDDLIISVNLYRWFMAFEWGQRGFAPDVVSFPASHDRQLCWEQAETELADPDQLAADAETITRDITLALAAGRRVWLLYQGQMEGPRWQVDARLFERLRESGIAITPVDEWAGLGRLVRSDR